MPPLEAGALERSLGELEALARGELSIAHFVVDVAPVRTGDKSFVAGYPDYQPAMDRLWLALFAAGLSSVTPSAYNDWLATKRPPLETAAEIDRLDLPELLVRLFAIRRAERFCDGYWTSVVESGLMLFYARRLLALIRPAGD